MSNRRRFTIIDAVDDRNLFAPWFKNKASRAAWFAFLRALFALPMTAEQLAIYQQCTGRVAPPTASATEGWLRTQIREKFHLEFVRSLSRRLPQLSAIPRSGRARHDHGDCLR